jgi:YidC/Oxa1 family membrane protein insertase
MDKNSWIGLLLIMAILLGWSYYTRPSEEQIQRERARRDSIMRVEQQRQLEIELQKTQAAEQAQIVSPEASDSAASEMLRNQYGEFAVCAVGEREFYTVENNLMKIKFTNLGGRIASVELKNYDSYDSLPVVLFEGDSTIFSLGFFAQNRRIETGKLFFTPSENIAAAKVESDSLVVSFTLDLGNDRSMKYIYTIKPDSYVVGFDIKMHNLNSLVPATSGYLTLNWESYLKRQEKGEKWEMMNSTIAYRYFNDDVEQLSETSDTDNETVNSRLQWVSFKQQFFNSTLIAKEGFANAAVKLEKTVSAKHLKHLTADLSLPYEGQPDETIAMEMFFGPNHFKTLKALDIDLQNIIPLGRSIFRWVNVGIVIPVFNFLGRFIDNFGVIILILTILIKLVLFPLTYKQYKSTGMMSALKPEIDKLNEKYPKQEDAMKKQQAMMDLYKRAGVSPMGGCLPVLLQMPLLIAMFRFFPASIELRHESFLWVDDLSTYDAILNLPFSIPWYGDHVSLFCLLMTIVNIIYIKMSGQANAGGQQMPGMKMMMYMMPIMMLFWFNDYAAALSYYYFLTLLITIVQTYVIKRTINPEEVLERLKTAKVQKAPTKSRFQQRLEEAAKKRGVKLPK